MTPRDLRNLLLLAIAVATLIALVTMQGCASMFAPELTWTKVQDASTSHKWMKLSRDDTFYICRRSPMTMPNLGGCAYATPHGPCIVYSMYSEDEAMRVISSDGEDLRAHELRHCDGFVHNDWR